MRLPPRQGLHDPAFEHDACGLGFVGASIEPRHTIPWRRSSRSSANLTHRGAPGCDPCTGDGAGILLQPSVGKPPSRWRSRSRPDVWGSHGSTAPYRVV